MILAGSVVLGMALLVLVFCIPTGRMREHVAASIDEIILPEEEVALKGPLEQYIRNGRESYTDEIMVQNCLERVEGKNIYEQAVWIYHHDINPETWVPEGSLQAYADENNEQQLFLHQYARYWHGYLIYLKPLLFLFTWKQGMALGVLMQLVLLGLVVWAACRRHKPEAAIAIAVGLAFMKPVLMAASFAMSSCWVITMAAMLVMLLFHEKLVQKNRYPEFFLIVGILTAYFDFLTYPVVTLGFPLCIYFLIKEKETWKNHLKQVVGFSLCWGIGYVGFWASKWILADVTLQSGTIKNAAGYLLGWTEAIGGRPRMNGGQYVLELILQQYHALFYPVAVAVLLFASVVLLIFACRSSVKKTLEALMPYGVIFFVPVVWMFVVQRHSALHTTFTFRILGVAAMAVCCMVIALIRRLR